MKIDTTQLYEGKMIKSYTELCDLVGLKKLPTKEQRENQLKRMRLYFKVRRLDRTKYKVVKVYHKGVYENLILERSKYVNEIIIILLNELLKSDDYEMHTTSTGLLTLFDLVTNNYADNKIGTVISEKGECSMECATEIVSNSKIRLKQILKAELNVLQKRNLISFHENICTITTNGEKHLENHKSSVRNKILQIEQEEIENLGCDNIQDIRRKHKMSEYEKKVAKKLNDNYDIVSYYRVLTIGLAIDKNDIPQFTEEQIQSAKTTLKKMVGKKVKDYLIDRKKNYKQKAYRKKVGNEDMKQRYKLLYPSNYRKCVDVALNVLMGIEIKNGK